MDERHDERRLGRERRHSLGADHLVWISVSGVVALVLIAFVAIYGITRLNDVVGTVKAQQDELASLRVEQGRASCLQQNESVMRLRQTFAASVGIVRPPGPPVPKLEAFITNYIDTVNATLRFRDCSDTGIRAYFNNPPAAPVPCKPDGKGFCQ